MAQFYWGKIRAVGMYQLLLDEPTPTLRDELENLISNENTSLGSYLEKNNLHVLFNLECFHFLRSCNSRTMAERCLENALAKSGLKISFSCSF